MEDIDYFSFSICCDIVPNIEHIQGKAADIYIPGRMEMAFSFIRNRCNYRQLINEHNLTWIHISYDEFDNKKQIFNI